MYIDVDTINKDDFQVQSRILNGEKVWLIGPTFTKHKWSSEDRHLRSLLLDASGHVISASLMKFHNYGECPDLDILTEESIRNGTSIFSEKMDGSLLIRSVINGQVHFRTRGSHNLGYPFDTNIMNLVQTRYPRLLDPSLDTRYSVLFEYTGPENQIVVKYDESTLTVLGLMDLSADPPEFVSSPETVKSLEETYGTPAVKFYDLNGSLKDIVEKIRNWKSAEGIVVWSYLPNGTILPCKIKAAEYIRIHTFKYQMTEERFTQFCWMKNIETFDQLKESLFLIGLDFEVCSFLEPMFNSYIERLKFVREQVNQFLEIIKREGFANLSRKEAVLEMKKLSENDSYLFQVGIEYLYGNGEVEKLIGSKVLGLGIKAIENFRKEYEESSFFDQQNAGD